MENVIDELFKYRPLTEEETKDYTKAVIVASGKEDPLSRYGFNVGDEVYAVASGLLNTLWVKKDLSSNKACSAYSFEVGILCDNSE